MMHIIKNTIKTTLLCAVVFLAGCAGKDGDPGPNGTNGANGVNGTNGVNGEGYNQATSHGNILVTFAGKRPVDSVAFSAVQDFKYYLESESPDNNSYVYNYPDGSKSFYVSRYLSVVNDDDDGNDNYIDIWMRVSAKGMVLDYEINAYTTVITGTKFFSIGQYTYFGDNQSALTDLGFDAKTGKLKFKVDWTILKSSSTGKDLSITGTADVIVYESLVDNRKRG